LLAYLGDRRDGYLFQEDIPPQRFCVTTGKPNKNESSVWWRGSWSEYPEGSGPGIQRWKWLGRASEMTRKEARSKCCSL
jgi:hypothetical protein